MKKLYIMRHAQKDESDLTIDDYDIPLTKKGQEDALKISKELAKDSNIDLIVSSPAKRTKMTSEILAKELNYTKNIMYNEVIYMSFLNELIETISYTFDTVNSMVVIGHNPSLTALAVTFVDFKEKMQMGSLVYIEFDCDSWTEISKDNAKLIYYKSP